MLTAGDWEENRESGGVTLDDARAALYDGCDSVEDYDERFEELFMEVGLYGGEAAMDAFKLYTIGGLLKGLRILKGALCMRDIFAVSVCGDPREQQHRGQVSPTHPYVRESTKIKSMRSVFDIHRARFEMVVAEAVDRYADPFGPLHPVDSSSEEQDAEAGLERARVKLECHRNELLAPEYMEVHQLWTTLVVCPLPDRKHIYMDRI